MKTYILNNLPIVAVLASFALIPVNTVAAGMAFTFTGVVAMLFADYGRSISPVSANPVHATELADTPLAA
ncbi:MAG TPA: hypothetical protein VFE25_12475 [Opitutaceae bacterium]|jgi:hypothetical protein|nr:hypothetical protein [Opitutaceae bacterium]